MPLAVIISGAVQILDIILRKSTKDPASAVQLSGLVGPLIEICSRAAEETPEQTAKRLTAHDALVTKYAAAPPQGVTT
jgi:hypothetical protein